MKIVPLIFALLITAPTVHANSRAVATRPLETFNGMTVEQLDDIAKFVQGSPENLQSLLDITRCVEDTLSASERNDLLSFAQSAKHNIREDCFKGDREDAAAYARKVFIEFSQKDTFKKMGQCIKSQRDIEMMTQLVMAQMGINPTSGEASHICDAYEKSQDKRLLLKP